MPNIHKQDDMQEFDQPETWAPSENDEQAWQEKAVLSLDGGGVRGYASLLILEALMAAIKEEELNHPDGPHKSSFQLPKIPDSPSPTTVDCVAKGPSAPPTIDSLNLRTPSWRNDQLRTGAKPLDDKISSQKATENEDCYLACHYFDYIFGTSTGGLNAIMLGRLRMDVRACTKMYPEMVRTIFGSPRFTSFKGIIKSKHDPMRLENQIKQLVRERMPEDRRQDLADTRFNGYPSPPDLCRTVVISKEILESDTVETERPYRFRTYNHLGRRGDHSSSNHGPADEVAIWKVARATSAALPYLELIKIRAHKYSDGGSLYNNPAKEAYHEVRSKEGRHPFPFALFVSIGTGMKPGDSNGDGPATKRQAVKGLAKTVKNNPFQVLKHPKTTLSNMVKKHPLVRGAKRALEALTNSERIHRDMEEEMREKGRIEDYYRWNVSSDVGVLKLDEWKPGKGQKKSTQTIIEESVKIFLKEHGGSITTCAKQLVNLRRARIRCDYQRWKRYTQCVEFGCPICGAAYTAKHDFEDLKRHVDDRHPQAAPSDLVSWIRWAEPYELKPLFKGGPY